MTAPRWQLDNPALLRGVFLMAAFLLLLTLGWFWIAILETQTERISAAQTKWQSASWAASRRDDIHRQLQSDRDELDQLGLLMPAADEKALQDSLRDILKAKLMQVGAQISATQPMPVEVTESYRKVRMRLQFAISADVLPETLRLIEADKPLMVIDAIDIVAQPNTDPTSRPQLTISLECSAFAETGKT